MEGPQISIINEDEMCRFVVLIPLDWTRYTWGIIKTPSKNNRKRGIKKKKKK
jgi:hypothetical protein